MANIYDFQVERHDGTLLNLESYRGKSLLIVNVASSCGFTSQYTELQKLYAEFKDRLEILGFPCNQFGGQEPGSDTEIQSFCSINYGVSFPILKKVEVNGKEAHPLFQYLKSSVPGILGTEAIKWNFTKFFVDKTGLPLLRFAPQETPYAVMEKIASLL